MNEYYEAVGMTDLQYKGMLIDQLYVWRDLLGSLPDISENTAVRKKIEYRAVFYWYSLSYTVSYDFIIKNNPIDL